MLKVSCRSSEVVESESLLQKTPRNVDNAPLLFNPSRLETELSPAKAAVDSDPSFCFLD